METTTETAAAEAARAGDGTISEAEARARARWRTMGWVALAVLACVLPFLLGGFQLFQIAHAFIYAIALLGLNILTGYNGQISLGHGAFFAVGAYTSAILITHDILGYIWCIPLAGAICLVVGFLFGLPALRLEGLYLAMATLALALALPQFLKHFEALTGGVQGIVIAKPNAPFGLPLDSDQWLYFLCLGVMVLAFLSGRNLIRGRIGRALVAIRDHHLAAEAMGINTAMYKSLAFGVSAMYTGIAGALSAVVVQFVAPDSFVFLLSITLLVGIVIGGLASISGAIYGAFFIQFVPTYMQDISKAAPWAIYGIFLIAFIFAMPTGIAGAVRQGVERLSRRFGPRPPGA